MCLSLSLTKLKASSSLNNLLLELDILAKDFTKSKCLWLSVYENEHIHSTGVLKLCILVKLIKNYLQISITTALDNNSHTCTATLVANACNSLNSLILYKVNHLFDKLTLIYHIRNFSYDNSMVLLVAFSLGANGNASSTCCISLENSLLAVNCSIGWEVRALYILHHLLNCCLGIVD